MSLPTILAAGAAVLFLIALLILQRRRAAADSADADGVAGGPADTAPDDTASERPLDADQWRPLGLGGRLKAVLRGGRHGIRLLRDPTVKIYRAVDGSAIRIVRAHDGIYGGRPNWAHVAEVTRAMGKAERCWPGAGLAGILNYTDRTVPVEYSPRLVADLEEDTAPDPDAATVA